MKRIILGLSLCLIIICIYWVNTVNCDWSEDEVASSTTGKEFTTLVKISSSLIVTGNLEVQGSGTGNVIDTACRVSTITINSCSATGNLTVQSNVYYVYGSTLMAGSTTSSFSINKISEILYFTATAKLIGSASNNAFNYFTTSFTITNDGTAQIWVWNAIVKK